MNNEWFENVKRGASDFWEVMQIPIIAVLAIVILSTASILAITKLSERDCGRIADKMGYPSYHTFSTGCMIEVEPGKWIPLDKYYYKGEPK